MRIIKKIKSLKIFNSKAGKSGGGMESVTKDILSFAIMGLVGAGAALGLTEFNNSSTVAANSFANNITNNSLGGILNVTTLFAVVGILIGVGLLLKVVLKFGQGKV